MEAIRPRLRALRAALFAALCVTLSSTSHVLMARGPLPLASVAGAYAAVFAVAYLLGGSRERGFPARRVIFSLVTAFSFCWVSIGWVSRWPR